MDKLTRIDVAALLGNLSDVDRELLQFHADCFALDQGISELIAQYPDQWAGMYKGTLTIAPTQGELITAMGEEGAKHMAWAFLSTRSIGETFLAA